MSTEKLLEGDGGFEIMQAHWLQGFSDDNFSSWLHTSKESVHIFRLVLSPNSFSSNTTSLNIYPTDSLQISYYSSSYLFKRKASLPSFEPNFKTVNSVLVHRRIEISFLPDPLLTSLRTI